MSEPERALSQHVMGRVHGSSNIEHTVADYIFRPQSVVIVLWILGTVYAAEITAMIAEVESTYSSSLVYIPSGRSLLLLLLAVGIMARNTEITNLTEYGFTILVYIALNQMWYETDWTQISTLYFSIRHGLLICLPLRSLFERSLYPRAVIVIAYLLVYAIFDYFFDRPGTGEF